MSSTVYIIVSLFNKADYVAQTVASITRQSIDNWRAIIVDDGSIDGSESIVRNMTQEEPRFAVLSQTNTGVAYARQAALRIVPDDAEFIMFLDADDVLENRALELLRGSLEEHPDAVGAVGKATFIDEGSVDVTEANQWRAFEDYASDKDYYNNDDFLVQSPITSPGQVLLRYQAHKDIGGFADHISGVEDWDLWYRLTASGGAFVRVRDVTFRYRVMQGSLSKRIAGMRASSLLMHQRWYRSAPTKLAKRRIVAGYTKHAVDAMPRIFKQLLIAAKTGQLRLVFLNLQRFTIACLRSQTWFTKFLLSRQ